MKQTKTLTNPTEEQLKQLKAEGWTVVKNRPSGAQKTGGGHIQVHEVTLRRIVP